MSSEHLQKIQPAPPPCTARSPSWTLRPKLCCLPAFSTSSSICQKALVTPTPRQPASNHCSPPLPSATMPCFWVTETACLLPPASRADTAAYKCISQSQHESPLPTPFPSLEREPHPYLARNVPHAPCSSGEPFLLLTLPVSPSVDPRALLQTHRHIPATGLGTCCPILERATMLYPQKFGCQTLSPSVIVFGGEPFGRQRGHECGVLMNGVSPLTKETVQDSQPPPPCEDTARRLSPRKEPSPAHVGT